MLRPYPVDDLRRKFLGFVGNAGGATLGEAFAA